ncbi:MAG: rRNA (uracil1498-N3)-methyltransferase [Actinomycetota bacterium]|jgi:16S rRNA (uracil1498-N3)-methyltransferase|nr:rRNA (uracil1498-N3)-methyltransferase [Actinomycetota bacterium]
MTSPVFLIDEVTGDHVVLSGPEGHHAARVRRLRVGETVDVVDGRGTRAACTVTAVGRETVDLAVVSRRLEPAASPRLVLVQALAKGDRGELAVELATEVGVDEIMPWSAARCVVKWDGERGAKALLRWRSTAREAAKQSRRSWVPDVREPHSTAQLVDRVKTAAASLLLHESADDPLAAHPLPDVGEILLVVGPEGGITDDELAVLTAAGATALRLGASVLRTSTAGAAGVAVVSALTNRWR